MFLLMSFRHFVPAEPKRKRGQDFFAACRQGDVETVKLLLAAEGIDVNQADNDGWTPLYWASGNGHVEVVKLLLAAPGIDVNKGANSGRTPLFTASWDGRAEVVKLLLATLGIDVNQADNEGCTPLYNASWDGHVEVVELLLAAPGIDVNQANNNGFTPLFWASGNGKTEAVKLLLAAPGIDVNKANNEGCTPLYIAIRNGRADVVKLLLRKPGIETSFVLAAFRKFQVVDTGLELNTADVINYTEPLTSPVRCLPCRCVFNFAGLHKWTKRNNTCPTCRQVIENVESMSEAAVTRWDAMKSLYEKAEEEEKRAKWLMAHAKTLLEASKAKQSENAFSNRFKTKLSLKF